MFPRTVRVIAAGALAMAAPILLAGPASADSMRARQWHLTALDITAVHKISQGAGVTVALIDTGVAKHRDLSAAVLAGTSVFPGQPGDGRDDIVGHGTEMAGIIAGRGHGSGDGVLGIAPKAEILPIRAPLQSGSNGSYILAAVDYAITHHAEVINLSFGMEDDDPLRQAILKARAANIVVVASAGNKNENAGPYPAQYPEVLTVGAVGRNGAVASFSVASPQVDLVAPGVQMVTTGKDGGYYENDGTSSAAAVVSGAAALLRAKFPALSAAEIVHRLTATAIDAGPKGRDNSYGYGRLNIVKALTADVRPLPSPSALSTAPGNDVPAAAPSPDDSDNTGLILGALTLGAVLIVAVIVAGVIFARGGHSTR